MIRISSAVRDIVQKNPVLQFGLTYKVLNLTQAAQYISPFVSVRTKKSVRTSALVMALSRLQKELIAKGPQTHDLTIENLAIHSDLCDITYLKSDKVHNSVQHLYQSVQKEKGFITITESTTEITIITDRRFQEMITSSIPEAPTILIENVSAIGVKFHRRYIEFPGMIYFLVQQITLQNINIVEIASTGTELIIFVAQEDTKLAFDTLFNLFYGK
ncbi:MAG: hypothetical protein HY817_02080 [Candidatus Abawacabacteria bacterium]|nr:hypothetical protein [Candidatus Abawacabacteria bacterium]